MMIDSNNSDLNSLKPNISIIKLQTIIAQQLTRYYGDNLKRYLNHHYHKQLIEISITKTGNLEYDQGNYDDMYAYLFKNPKKKSVTNYDVELIYGELVKTLTPSLIATLANSYLFDDLDIKNIIIEWLIQHYLQNIFSNNLIIDQHSTLIQSIINNIDQCSEQLLANWTYIQANSANNHTAIKQIIDLYTYVKQHNNNYNYQTKVLINKLAI